MLAHTVCVVFIGTGVTELVALVRDLQAQLVATTEAAAMWQERAGMLTDRLALAESKLAQSQAPAESTLTASIATQGREPMPEPSRLP